jgi:2-succinyl-5-enolpyruvyl-6-hydroxy-3-cyclohexene-1-carboxylate synthase
MMSPNLSMAWADAIVGVLAELGVRHVITSPGSRSAPLALAAAAHPALNDRSILDERSASFFALGLARAERAPVALVCTSGTASANYLPAVVEASYSGVPLVLLTADRPPELRDVGAAQTIEQSGIYGAYVRWACDLAPPEPTRRGFDALTANVARAVAAAGGPPPGPVHLNVPLREPLAPVPVPEERAALDALERGTYPRLCPAPPELVPPERTLDELARWVTEEPRGWIVVGPLDADGRALQALTNLALRSGWPLVADVLSQLRSGPHERGLLVDAHEAVLGARELVASRLPRRVLRFGGLPTSKALTTLLDTRRELDLRVVASHAWPDPTRRATALVRADPTRLAEELAARLPVDPPPSAFGADWIRAGRRARGWIDSQLRNASELDELSLVPALHAAVPDGTTVFLANSSPVRDVDLLWHGDARTLRFAANRGANGIDGTLSTALGAAAAGPVVALVGDLALLHDASGLLAARGGTATVVLVDNAGGGIFERLPAAHSVERATFERHLATPQQVDLGAWLHGAGFQCDDVAKPAELVELVLASTTRSGVQFVRVRTDRFVSVERRRKLVSSVAAMLDAEEDVGG